MKITESKLNQIIRESIKKNLFEMKVREMVAESLMNNGYFPNEAEDDETDKGENIEDMTLDDLGLGDKTLNDLGLDANDIEGADFDTLDDSDDDEEDKKGDSEDDEEDSTGINQIEKYFNKSGIDNAPFAYELFDVKPEKGKDTNDMKNARHLFAAKKNHDLNDNGYPYSFTPSEKNELQNMISSAGLSEAKINEAVKQAIKKVLK